MRLPSQALKIASLIILTWYRANQSSTSNRLQSFFDALAMRSSAMTTISSTFTVATTPTVPSILNVQISEKLTKSNYLLWNAQVLLALCAVQLQDLLTSVKMALTKEIMTMVDDKPIKQINPAYSTWVARDQAILGYLLSTLTRETLMHVS
jgi:hypothetical protein